MQIRDLIWRFYMCEKKVDVFRLTAAYCIYNKIAIFEQKGCEIVFIMQDLSNEFLQKRIEKAFINHINEIQKNKNCPESLREKPMVSFIQGSKEELRRCISKLYTSDNIDFENENKSVRYSKHEDLIYEEFNLLDKIICEARSLNATDIHIEENSVRFRINGVLEKHLESNPKKILELIERIKTLCGMNICEKRKSQEGKFIYGNTNPVFIKVSVVPIISNIMENAESVVIRLVGTNKEPLKVCDLGFNSYQINKIHELECLKNGLILICGPNSSGKSTTIASILTEIQDKNKEKLKIINLEDSPKYLLPNVSQIQIDERFRKSYEKELENIFNQDPDVIVIGEIRNEVSAVTALRASLTGYLVFATLHCSSVGESILRLENFGLCRGLLGSVVKGIICQSIDINNQKRVLYADVAIPCEKIREKIKPYYSENQIEQLFVHYTNYSQVLDNTLSSFKEIIKRDSYSDNEMDKKKKHQMYIPKNYSVKKKQKKII